MTNLAEHQVLRPCRPRSSKPSHGAETCDARCNDPRWPAAVSALRGLRAANRRTVRIVDADCNDGKLLLCAVRQAIAMGFTAIEARGLDDSLARVARARALAACLIDPAVGISFEATDPVSALIEECDFPADIVIAHQDALSDAQIAPLLEDAGRMVIVEPRQSAELAA
ncbi:SAM-dependent methyltransferase [Blastomonas sp. UPD001]|uniref:SAM-dependent methyltransferase n=1 Tax=Blastomonas sp. UPD001 TaxID=2217673 RepID=UPI001E2E40C2|nr:SAM-dependent methyltransferase [Blastomonas sp. UPD001]